MKTGQFSFLLLGAGRGGTSLLAGLLDQHSQLEVGFELFSQNYLMGKSLETADITTRVQRFIDACRDEADKFPEQIWGNKITTEQVYGLEDFNLAKPKQTLDVLDIFFNQMLAGIKVVFILRDGRTCVRSKMARTGQPLEMACERWRYSVKVWQFLQARQQHNLCLRYEDLLSDPEIQARRLCEFLEIPFEPTMLTGTNSEKMRPEYRQNSIDASKLDLADIPAGCEALIQAELKLCGY